MKKVFLLTSLFVASISMAQEATCPVTGKTASSAKESAAYDKHLLLCLRTPQARAASRC